MFDDFPIWIFALVAFVVFDFLLVLFVFLRKGRTKKFSAEELQYIRSHWIRIIDSCGVHPGQAVIDGDKLLAYALEKKGFYGSVADKLKASGPRFSDINGLWNAHKLRNKVAHELGDISKDSAKSALVAFKRGLNDLGANL